MDHTSDDQGKNLVILNASSKLSLDQTQCQLNDVTNYSNGKQETLFKSDSFDTLNLKVAQILGSGFKSCRTVNSRLANTSLLRTLR